MPADVKFEVVRSLLPISGSRDITISGFGTPKAAIFLLTNADANDVTRTHARMSIGFTDFTRQTCQSYYDPTGQSKSKTARFQGDDCVAALVRYGATPEVLSKYTAVATTDGVTVTYASGTETLERLCTVILIGGADVADVYAGTHDDLGNTTSPVSVTAPGFEPTLSLFAATGNSAAPPTVDIAAILSFGCAVNHSSGIQQACQMVSATTGQNFSRLNSRFSDQYVMGQLYAESLAWEAGVTSFDATGFTLTPATSAGNDVFSYIAIRLTGGADAALRVASVNNTTSWREGFGFRPSFGMAVVNAPYAGAPNVSDETEGVGLSIAAFDDSNLYSSTIVSQDGLDTTFSVSHASDTLELFTDSASNFSGSVANSFDGAGWKIDFSSSWSLARNFWALAIGDGTVTHKANTVIPSSEPSADITDFVLPVDMSLLPQALHDALAGTDGGSIRILQNGSECPRHIVEYDDVADTGRMYVKCDTSVITDQTLNIFADGVSSDYAVTDPMGQYAVWSDCEAVFFGGSLENRAGGSDLVVASGSPTPVGFTHDTPGGSPIGALPFSGSPVQLGVVVVSPEALQQGQTIEQALLTQHHVLVIDNLTQGQTLESSSPTQAHSIGLDGVAQSQSIEPVGLTQAGALSPESVSQDQTLQEPSLTQQYTLPLEGLSQDQALSETTLVQAGSLQPAKLTHNQTLETAQLTQAHVIVPNGIVQGQAIDAATLQLMFSVSPDDMTQAQTLDEALMVAAGSISVQGLTQAQALQAVSLLQQSVLAPNNIAQGQSISEPNFANLSNSIFPANLSQGQELDPVALTQYSVLQVDNLTQAQLLQAAFFGGLVIGELQCDIAVFAAVEGELIVFPALSGDVN